MKKITARVAVVAVLATALVAGMATSANAVVGSNATQTNGSDGPLYIWNAANTALITSGAYTTSAIAAGSKTDVNAPLTCPAGSDGAAAFVSKQGNERRSISTATGSDLPNGWIAQTGASFSSGTKNVIGANIKISGLTNGSSSDVKVAGNYSLGIACTSSSGAVVDKVFYVYITTTGSAGDWTAAATDYSYPTPTLSYTQAVANQNHTPNAFALPHVGDTINAVIDAASIPDGFAVHYQWKSGATNVGTDSATYTTVDNDAGKTFTVVATYTRSGYTDVSRTSLSSAAVEGTAVVSGAITVNANVVAASNGQLSLDVATTSVTLTGALNGSNKSESTGTLPNVIVNDGRVTSLDGWKLTASVTDFTNSGVTPSAVIDKTQLAITPNIVSKPTDGNAVANTARSVGAAFSGINSNEYLLAKAEPITGATTDKTYVGATTVNAALKLVAPQWKPAGTYSATMTITVTSW